MSFLKRIGYGWLLLTESFFSIVRQNTNLIKIAAFISAMPFVLLLIANIPALDGLSILTVALGGIVIFIVYIVAYIIQAALYYYFSVFLQEGKRVPLEAALEVITLKAGYILLWLIFNNVIHSLTYLFGASSWFGVLSFWKILSSIGVTHYSITAVSFIGSLVQLLWNWVSFFVLASIVLDNAGIVKALKTSTRIALRKIPELIGFGLWNIVISSWPLGIASLFLARPEDTAPISFESVPLLFKISVLYCVALFFVVLFFAYVLFTVALYLSSTGRLVSRLGRLNLQEYFLQQAQQNTMLNLQD